MHTTSRRANARLTRMQSSIFSLHAFNFHCMQCKNYVYIFTLVYKQYMLEPALPKQQQKEKT